MERKLPELKNTYVFFEQNGSYENKYIMQVMGLVLFQAEQSDRVKIGCAL